MTTFVSVDGPLDQVWQTMAATDGLALLQTVPLVFSVLHRINDNYI